MTSVPTDVPRFRLDLPPGWIRLERSDERIATQVARILDEHLPVGGPGAPHRGALGRQLTAALRSARERDVAFAAVLATTTPDGLPIAASLAVTVHPRPSGTDAFEVLAGLRARTSATTGLVQLPFTGTVVRSAYRDRVPVESAAAAAHGPATAEVAVVQHYLVPPDGRRVALLTGVTPTLPMAAVFEQLFDAVATTFQFLAPGEPA